MKGFFKDPGNLRYSLNTIVPLVVFLTSLLSISIGLNLFSLTKGRVSWVLILGTCVFSSFCSMVVIRAMTQPISNLVKKAEQFIRLEEFRKERGQMIEVYNLIERLMDYAQTKTDEAERKALIESMEKLDYIIPLGYMSLMVAHEVRNPLNTITGMSELLQQRVADEGQRRYIETTLEAARKIDVFTRELLDFTDNELVMEELDIYNVVHDAIRAITTVNPDIRFDYPKKGSLVCMGDKTKLYQVLLNILKNAASYEEDGDTIKVTLSHSKEKMFVSVFNKNSRIDKDDYDSIFKPFFTRKKGGRGLGLFIALRNMKLHGGDIGVESSEKGTTFTIELPLQKGQEAGKEVKK